MYEIISLKEKTSLKNPLTIGLGVIFQALQGLFAGADPGHWDGNRFIPGDLQSRLQVAAAKISSYGAAVASVVDQTRIYDILTTPGIWQEGIDEYLNQLKQGIDSGEIVPGQVQNTLLPPGTKGTGGGFFYNIQSFGNLLPVVAVGGLLIYAITKKPKRKKKH